MKIITSKQLSTLSLGAVFTALAGTAQAVEFKAGNTDVDLYGYAKLDVIYDLDADLGNAVLRNRIPLDHEPGADGHLTMHAFESRLGFTTSTLIDGDVLRTVIETDFYGGGGFADGGGELRLRHAYGEWKGLLAGQTWTNFGNVLSLYETIDFNRDLGQGGGRQAQLRYTTGPFSFSVEDPKGTGTGHAGGEVIAEDTNQFRFPDLTARYQNTAGPVQFATAALVRFLEYDAEGETVSNSAWSDDSATGWGVMAEARAQLTDTLTLRGSVTHGDGIGGYLYLSPAAPGYVSSSGKLETIEGTGGGVSLSAKTGPGLLTLAYGVAQADVDDAYRDGAIAGTADERYTSGTINYLWSTNPYLTYGVEAGYHTREQVDGREGDAVRLQGMVRFNF
ncbi:DcaP family trimeric outer membrane transporter [Alloalcanivorax sp. C16-2]|uniref:DcaP family trimeric outer membrane transporter n=1 Tax=Alloalcanivorax TaxID=3020832 RepID=UPI0019324128|nr:DcaP family trimeric outer membrane transporter [Alloalcanivorax marinus]MBL7250847.1 hypothetical protein [Alloalcanivorax marinus]